MMRQMTPNLLGRVTTGDESWIFKYDRETKRQSLLWKSLMSPRPKKARQLKSKVKVMLIAKNIDEIKMAVMTGLRRILEESFQEWQRWLEKCAGL